MMRIALASLDQQWEDKEANLAQCDVLATRAAEFGAELIIFPEMTLTGFTMNAQAIVEERDASPSVAAFGHIARERRIAVAFGVVLQGAVRPQNCLVVIDGYGNEQGRYVKLHPFTHADEHNHYEPGNMPATATIAGAVFGLSICYDLRFPELYTALAPSCSAVIVIASWPERRIAHWHALLVARAIDCQCYVIGVNRSGEDANGFRYPRTSCVVDPRGHVLTPDLIDGELDMFTIDAAQVTAYREVFPTLRDRRPDLYRELLRAQ